MLPFIFIGGLIGLIFNELIITLSASILASLLVALTLVPALGARLTQGDKPAATHKQMKWLQQRYLNLLQYSLGKPALIFIVTTPLVIASAWILWHSKEIFLPDMDQGQINIRINGDPGIRLDALDRAMKKVEDLLMQQPEVQSVFPLAGGPVFGRPSRETPNQGSFNVQ